MDLQTAIVYGPAATRRFGRALGVNLAPPARKACNFDCAYCSSQWRAAPARSEWPAADAIVAAVDGALAACGGVETVLVAGNGEPTLHPAFARIAEGLSAVKARRVPEAKLALLSNGSTLDRLDVTYSLGAFDIRCMKLDAGDATTFRVMNGPATALGRILSNLRQVGRLSLVSTFVRDASGRAGNATPGAVRAWLEALKRVAPETVDLCTPHRVLRAPFEPVSATTLEEIADRVRALGIRARVFA